MVKAFQHQLALHKKHWVSVSFYHLVLLSIRCSISTPDSLSDESGDRARFGLTSFEMKHSYRIQIKLIFISEKALWSSAQTRIRYYTQPIQAILLPITFWRSRPILPLSFCSSCQPYNPESRIPSFHTKKAGRCLIQNLTLLLLLIAGVMGKQQEVPHLSKKLSWPCSTFSYVLLN